MPRHQGPVLVDTNVILETHRVRAWRALSRAYAVETVEECVTETQTGFPNRAQEHQIDPQQLRDDLSAVHSARPQEFAALAPRTADIRLDPGERELWAHALGRKDNWMLCGPDKTSLLCGIRLGFRECMVSLERLLEDAGHRPHRPLHDNYMKRWLRNALNELAALEREAP